MKERSGATSIAPLFCILEFQLMRHDLYDPAQFAYRVKYARQCIIRGMEDGTRHFDTCFEMNDGDDVARALLKSGLRNERFREAMYRSRLITLDHWLTQLHPEFADAYAALDPKYLQRRPR
jgi:hypothetical protein